MDSPLSLFYYIIVVVINVMIMTSFLYNVSQHNRDKHWFDYGTYNDIFAVKCMIGLGMVMTFIPLVNVIILLVVLYFCLVIFMDWYANEDESK